MKRSELLVRIIIIVAIIGAVGTPIYFWLRTPLIHARVAENGGWNPNLIQAQVGKPLHLSLTSDDVVHGFAIGQMNMQSVDVLPGKVTDVTLNFSKPGTYTFYCTRWCGINHWRMRGTIEVTGETDSPTLTTHPLYVTLGLDIDASHNAPVIPNDKPSAPLARDLRSDPTISGQQLATDVSISQFVNADYYHAHSPYETWRQIRNDSSFNYMSDQQIWNLVAFIWQSNTTSESLANGKQLYTQNCAACHGENGAGNGVFANQIEAENKLRMQGMLGITGTQGPADFTNPKSMLGASPALLQGKILRGGMGTGMPSWGPIFTEEQTWNLVAYLYSFQFEYQK